MNTQPTPRTEAVMVDPLSDGNDLPQLARQLETELSEVLRERDEALEALRKAIIFVDAYEPHSLGVQEQHNETLSIIRKVLEEAK